MTTEHFAALGSVISVDIPDDDRARVRAQWSRCMTRPDTTADSSVTYGAMQDAHERDYGLASALTLAGIQHAAGRRLMLHAAGVADPATGRVAALVAPSGTGKTTAARRLCTAGFGYVTDETVSIGADNSVLPYPKPLSMVISGELPLHKSQHGPDELGLGTCPADPRAALIVVLDRTTEGPAEPQLERMQLLDGVLELIPQTSALPSMVRPLATLVRSVRAAGGVWRLRYREIDDATELLREALRRSAPEDDIPVVEYGGDELGQDAQPCDGYVARAPYSDAVGIGDEVLVLTGAVPARLSGIGATLWIAGDRPISIAGLTELCVTHHGPHPDAAQLVRDAIDTLVAHQLLGQSASRGTN